MINRRRGHVMEQGSSLNIRSVAIDPGVAEHPGARDVHLVRKDRPRDVWRKPIVVVVNIHQVASLELLEVAKARDFLALGFGSVQGGQQERCQDGNNADYDQKFHKSESVRASSAITETVISAG